MDDSDTDKEEHVSERDDNSEYELSDGSNAENKADSSTEAYIAHLKKNGKVLDSWIWKKIQTKKYTLEGWAQIIRLARNKPCPFEVTYLLHNDFLDFNQGKVTFALKNKLKPKNKKNNMKNKMKRTDYMSTSDPKRCRLQSNANPEDWRRCKK
ncbi:unnamed protein product [Diabrotica balteata]|uniref:Uncharacterized protein n=1 Tax=Diabrotica balteata TaxID=107213 RepID=A0A9N9T540_DIABA|nr:unnamed protein product [Diabrotica balteata]